MAQQLPEMADVTFGPVKGFKTGTTRMIAPRAGAGDITFTVSGPVMFNMLPPFENGRADRRSVLINLDDPKDDNTAVKEFMRAFDGRIVNHLADNVATAFPDKKIDPEVIRKKEFSILSDFSGTTCLKLHMEFSSVTVLIPTGEDTGDANVVSNRRVPADLIPDVMLQGAHVTAHCRVAFISIDKFKFSLTCETTRIMMTPPPARTIHTLADMRNGTADRVGVGKCRPYKSGAGKYAPMQLQGSYPRFCLHDSVGSAADMPRVLFDPRIPPSVTNDRGVPTFPFAIAKGSDVHTVITGMDRRFMAMACDPALAWSKITPSPDEIPYTYRSPCMCKDDSDYDPCIYVKVLNQDGPGCERTRVYMVPDDVECMSTVDALAAGWPEVPIDEIRKGMSATVVAEASCIYIVENVGWTLRATHVFLHRGSLPPMVQDGKTVHVTGVASAADILACFGGKRAHPDDDDLDDDDAGAKLPRIDEEDDQYTQTFDGEY
jgi:hypothetical protein